MDVARRDRSRYGDSPIVIMFLAGCYTICTVTALVMGYDGYLVLAAASFLGGLFSWELKGKLDTKSIRGLQKTVADNWEFIYHLQERLGEARRQLEKTKKTISEK